MWWTLTGMALWWGFAVAAVGGLVLFVAAVARAGVEDRNGDNSNLAVSLAWCSALFSTIGGVGLLILSAMHG